MVNRLPSNETMSLTYCNCARGFVEEYWEEVLERPVRVELMESSISGSNVCKFVVSL